MTLEIITRQELEDERITGRDKSKVSCKFDYVCTEQGNFERCYLSTCVQCPRHGSYDAQKESDYDSRKR